MKPVRSPLNPGTRSKVVTGCIAKPTSPIPHAARIVVRVTDDRRGKSLSLEDGKTMLMIPLEEVADMLATVHE